MKTLTLVVGVLLVGGLGLGCGRPEGVIDRATYEAPHQYPAGISHVLVNAVVVVRDGAHTEARPGRTLTRTATAP